MLNRKVTILFVGLMSFSFVSGFSTVICHGSDGRVAVKAVIHNHCECSETDQNGKQENFAGTIIGFSNDHEHCKDTIATPNVLFPIRKNVKPSTHKFFTTNLTPNRISAYIPSFFICFPTQSSELSSFHRPLRAVILLA